MTGRPSRDEALEYLAQQLYWKFEHIDPTGENWGDLDEPTRDMYRSATRHLFDAPDEYLIAAFGRPQRLIDEQRQIQANGDAATG